MAEDKQLNIVLLGPPGSGKGVQSELLEKHFKMKRILMGEILRMEARKKTKIARKIKQAMNQGRLVDSKLVMQIAKKHIRKAKQGILFDGFPRDLYEAKKLDKMLNINKVFFMTIPQKIIIRRLAAGMNAIAG